MLGQWTPRGRPWNLSVGCVVLWLVPGLHCGRPCFPEPPTRALCCTPTPAAMVRLSNDEFLAGLTELFAAGTEKGSVYVTFKHHMDGETPVCLVRAVLGSTKSSTFVRAACPFPIVYSWS